MSDSARDDLLDLVRQLAAQVVWQRDLDLVELPLRGPWPVVSVTPDAPDAPSPEAPPVAVLEPPVAVLEPSPAVAAAPPVAPPAVVAAPPAPTPPPAPVAPLAERAVPPALRALFAEAAPPPRIPTVAVPARLEGAARVEALRVLQDEVAGCTRCRLAPGRTQTVFARGNPLARVMFVGEGPGEHEDRQGLPFVGRAGQLLDRIIGAMGLDPAQDVYIANVVKCRPPSNRNPEPDEMDACGPYLQQQLGMIRPEVIVVLGKVAAHYLLKVNAPMGKLRGQWTKWEGIDVMPTWHPAYVLREMERPGSTARREVWTDVQRVMERLGLPRTTG